MSILLDPLEEDQVTLINIIWPAFMTEMADWPRYNYIEYRMRERGLDARSVIGGMPTIGKSQYHGGYAPVGYLSSGGILTADSSVYLTMAGLYHLRYDGAMQIIGAILAYLRQMTRARDVIGKRPYDVPDTVVQLSNALKVEGEDSQIMPWASAITEHEWPSMRCHRTVNPYDATGTLTYLHDANFYTIEEYLLAITAATTPQQPASVLDYRDPRALLRTIDHFDVTSELVLGQKLVARPPMGRSALLAQDAQSHADLQSGMSAIGEIMSELQVPGNKPNYATGRLLPWMKSQLPNLTQAGCARVQSSIDILDSVREIRNSGQHPKPKKKLIDAHELLGLPFPIQDPASAWDLIRAQLDLAFEALQQEILAAR
jgi:hypothetical protein